MTLGGRNASTTKPARTPVLSIASRRQNKAVVHNNARNRNPSRGAPFIVVVFVDVTIVGKTEIDSNDRVELKQSSQVRVRAHDPDLRKQEHV
mmetsp:Transcript_29313/g.62831  ORF Transcript_29313/g.62831 Transcript_29313/m.62831 type:complete len:92 (-) Transcript_29313:9-284(-)